LEHESSVAADKELVHHPHVVTTPHIAFYADDSVRTMYADCFESIAQWQRGEKPTHTVN
jgi:phosphoglycerate dehydrogenase-like enzyme